MTTEFVVFVGGLLLIVVLIATLTGNERYPGGTVILLPQVSNEVPPQSSGVLAILALLLLLVALALSIPQ